MRSLGCNSLRILRGSLDIIFCVVWVVRFYVFILEDIIMLELVVDRYLFVWCRF